MTLHYCSLHTRLCSQRGQRWVTFSQATIHEVRGYYDLLCSINRDASFLQVNEASPQQATGYHKEEHYL